VTGQVQTAPAPHFTHTEFRPGGVIVAVCPCGGLSAPAVSHEHSCKLGDAHKAEAAAADRQAERDALIAEMGL